MTKPFLLLFILLYGVMSQAQAQTKPAQKPAAKAKAFSLVGKWKSISGNETAYFIFSKDGSVKMIFEKDTMGGKKFRATPTDTFYSSLMYRFDTLSKPFKLDLVITRHGSHKVMSSAALGIFEIIDNSNMLLRLNLENDKRPKDFLPEGNDETMHLKRVK